MSSERPSKLIYCQTKPNPKESPFVVPSQCHQRDGSWRLEGSKSLISPGTGEDQSRAAESKQVDGSLARRRSIADARLSPATLRRLSWRRKVAPRPKLNSLETRQRLLAASQTFSVGETNSTTSLSRLLASSRECRRLAAVEASWSSLEKCRGKYGESLVHILIVNQTNESLLLLVVLLHLWPRLLLDSFQSQKFRGLSCIHLSIAYSNEKLLDYLLSLADSQLNPKQKKDLIELPVTGSLFRNPLNKSSKQVANDTRSFWCDQIDHWPTANGRQHLILFDRILTNSRTEENCNQPAIYLGQSALSWSVSFDSRAMYELLVHEGQADQNGQDADGNSCLHQLVINNQTGWARFLVKSGARLELVNNHQLTPFLLACHLGRPRLFDEILELSAVEFWSYSMIRCCGYPLASLDSIQPDSSKLRSAMAVILESEVSDNEQKSQLLSSAVVKKLLEEKWRLYARQLFYFELMLALAHLLLMTAAISLRDSTEQVDSLVHLWQDRQLMVSCEEVESKSNALKLTEKFICSSCDICANLEQFAFRAIK